MANIFSNLGPGLAKAAGEQSNFSRIVNGDANHFNLQQNKANKKLAKKNATETAFSSMKRNVKDYFNAQDLNYKDTVHLRNKAKLARGGMALAAFGGAALATRYADGGSLTRNSKGEKDIAGIPFI